MTTSIVLPGLLRRAAGEWRGGRGLAAAASLEQVLRPGEPDHGDHDAPGGREDDVVRMRRAREQPRTASVVGVNGWFRASDKHVGTTGTHRDESDELRLDGIANR